MKRSETKLKEAEPTSPIGTTIKVQHEPLKTLAETATKKLVVDERDVPRAARKTCWSHGQTAWDPSVTQSLRLLHHSVDLLHEKLDIIAAQMNDSSSEASTASPTSVTDIDLLNK